MPVPVRVAALSPFSVTVNLRSRHKMRPVEERQPRNRPFM